MNVTDLIGLYLKFGLALPPVMLIVALYANWQGIWYWGRDVADLQKRLSTAEHDLAAFRLRYDYVVQEKEEYKAAALYGMQVVRTHMPAAVAEALPSLPAHRAPEPVPVDPVTSTLDGQDAR